MAERGHGASARFLLAAGGEIRRLSTRWLIKWQRKACWAKMDAKLLGTAKRLEIIPLYEAEGNRDYQCGAGVSYLIRTDRSTILFDLGNNPKALSPSPLAMNMAALGIAMDDIDMIFLSHRHPDHVGGWKWWKKRTFSTDGEEQSNLGDMPVYSSDRLRYPAKEVTAIHAPRRLSEGVASVGPFAFFEPYPSMSSLPNYSEQALAVNVLGLGLVLIVGCGHMGVEVLLERAAAVFDIPVRGIVGGLHYMELSSEALNPDVERIARTRPAVIAVSSHDSGPAAVGAFAHAFPEEFRHVRVGEAIRF